MYRSSAVLLGVRGRAVVVGLAVLCGLLQPVLVGRPAPAWAEEPPAEAVTADAAQEAARAGGKPVRVLSQMGENREVVANPDGTFTQTLNSQVVRAREDGRWKAIDLTLQRRADGDLEPAVSSVGLVLSGGGTEPFARLSRAGRELAFTWPDGLPQPQLEGDTAKYVNVLQDVDLQVQALADGFRTVIVIRTPEAAKNPKLDALRLAVGGSRVSVQADADGGLRAVDSAGGGVLFEAPEPLMWDSSTVASAPMGTFSLRASAAEAGPGDSRVGEPSGEQLERGPGEGSKVATLQAEVGAGALTLKPDQELLAGPGTTYPVYLDPAWTTPRAAAWAMVSSKYPNTSYWKFDGSFSEGMGLCNDADPYMSNCGGVTKKRLFYRFPTTAFLDKSIIHAEFEGYQNHSYSCTKTQVQLWQVKWFGTQTTWNTQSASGYWQEYLQGKDTNAGGGQSCPSNQVIFNNAEVKAAVVAAAQGSAGTIQFGLKAGNENAVSGWKRFTWGAILRVKYNSLPAKPDLATMKMITGGECRSAATEATAPYVSEAPQLYATITDKDPDERLKAEFEASWPSTLGGTDWAVRWTGVSSWYAKGSKFSYQLTKSIPADGRAIRWRVRGIDRDPDTGAVYGSGAWSQYCYLRYDTSKPDPPTVTSADGRYPISDPKDPADPWHDGVGVHGKFTFTPAATDVVKYTWSVDGESYERTVPKGASLQVDVLPESSGPKILNVQAFDGANNPSKSASFPFRVKAGRAAKAHWELDEAPGAATLADARDDGEGFPAAVNGGVTLGGASKAPGTSLAANGTDGYAATSGPVVDASKSYSVAAWVNLTEKDSWATAVAQDGPTASSFYLQYSLANDRWSMSTGGTRALSAAAPTLGEWVHLVGVYDAVAKQARLYVNGEQQGLVNVPAPWPGGGDGPLTIGRAKSGGNPADFFPGHIDDVRVYDRVLTVPEAASLSTVKPTVAGRWKLNAKGGSGPVVSQDDSDHDRDLTLHGQADIPTTGTPLVGDGDLVLNSGGTGGYAATTGPVLRTNQSFSIAGWASPAGVPGQNAAVFSQRGNLNSGFTVRYSPAALGGVGGWQIEMPDRDSTGAVAHVADHRTCRVCEGETAPDHLVLTYNAANDTMTLYVNGNKSDETPSYKTGVVGFPAVGDLQLGRTRNGGADGEYFSGVIDDVWAFDGVLSDDQIGTLATGGEIGTDPGP